LLAEFLLLVHKKNIQLPSHAKYFAKC